MKTPFLRQVAQYFHRNGINNDYCFVLPNHRSCSFLERELDLASNGPYLMPRVITITDFVTLLAQLEPVPPVEAIFILYKCYTAIAGNEDYPFDKFVYWGNVLLGDFNDVDMYLVDPEQIFSNIKDLREIQANYIDSDVREVVQRYLNMSVEGMASRGDDFWKNNYSQPAGADEQVKKEFMRLWNSMLVLYRNFNEQLRHMGLSSMGNIYRRASEMVKQGHDLGHQQYVMVGFNALSTSEIAIFKRLKSAGKALFFWDDASPAFKPIETSGAPRHQTHQGINPSTGVNPAGRFVNFCKGEFPQPLDFVPQEVNAFPATKVYGVPSNVGQVQWASRLLDEMERDGLLASDNATSTALVLPDESLFPHLLNALNVHVPINVTMGYPLHDSDIASLMRIVAKMHRQARRAGDGEWTYYRRQVKTVLSHPLIKTCFAQEALEVQMVIDEANLFSVPESVFKDKAFAMLFETVDRDGDLESVLRYLAGMSQFCSLVNERLGTDAPVPASTDENSPRLSLQQAFLNQYINLINTLIDALKRYQLPPCEATIFFLIDRLASMTSIPFEGEPLEGMQVMGMLETRCLDFDNVIILSASESVLPRKFRTSSFITDYMRRYYGMSTVADQEAMWGYYFYRLIGRAQNLILLHDTSTQSTDSKEITRYVPQLEMIYGCQVEHCQLSLNTSVIDNVAIAVPKRGRVSQVLESYKRQGGKRHSASSINEYINCPLSFYMHYIERLSTDSDDEDFMGAGTFGTIVHNTLQQLYYPDVDSQPRVGEHKVTCEALKHFLKNKLEAVVQHEVNRCYLRSADLDRPLAGEAAIISVAIAGTVRDAINYDIDLLGNIDSNYFTVLECEKKHSGIVLDYGGQKFNFTFTADRIDRIADGTLRMVDYKTGSDRTFFSSMNDIFDPNVKKRCKAVLQLMLYCKAYAMEMNYDGPIMPMIYKLRDMGKSGVFFGTEKKKVQVTDYRDFSVEFNERMDEVISGFFDLNKKFTPTTVVNPKDRPCRYCKFADFCRR